MKCLWSITLGARSFLRPRPDLVPVPGHCALALKGMLFRHCGAISFVSIWCGVGGVAIFWAPQPHSGTWVKAWLCWNLVKTSARARGQYLNTTFRESARTRVPCSSFCTGTIKMLCSLWCLCPSTEPGNQVQMQPKRRAMKCDKRSAKQWRERK